MNERYDHQLVELQSGIHAARQRERLHYDTATLPGDVKSHVQALKGREVDKSFQEVILDTMIVYPGRRLEIRLNLLP